MALRYHVKNWRAYWRPGPALAEANEEAEELSDAIEQRQRTGRPLAATNGIAGQEERTGRTIAKKKPGQKPKTTS